MFRLEFEFAVLDGCSRVVVVVTERAKGRVEVEGGGGGEVGGNLGADKVAGQLLLRVKVQDLCVLLVLKETCKTRSPNL